MGPTALALVRALGRKGIPVYGVGLSKYEVALSSKYCKPLGATDSRYDPHKLLELLVDFASKQSGAKNPVLYPSGDECVEFIGANYSTLSGYYSFSKLNPTLVELFLDKALFYQACIQHGLPAPLTVLPESASELESISKELTYPCIVKPRYYHRWAMNHGLVKGVVCQKPDELRILAERWANDLHHFIIQEVIDGLETDIYVFAAYFDRNSNPHGVFVGQKIRQYPVGFGTTTMMRTAHKPELEEMSISFLQKVGYEGLCDVEYKYDRRDGSCRIVEINPRIGRWYGIVEAAGHDTIYYSYLDLTDRPIRDVHTESKDVTWAFTSRDFLSVIENKRWGVMSALRSYSGTKTWCIWARDDVKPFFAYFGEMATKGVKYLWRQRNHR